MNEDTSPQCESFPCHCGASFERLPSGGFACPGCGATCSSTGRSPTDISLKHALNDLCNDLARQPVNFAEAEARGWPGPYVEYTEADARIWEQLNALERELYPEYFSDTEESD